MVATEPIVQLSACGGSAHLADLMRFRHLGLPIPHQYSSWPLHSDDGRWFWCRATTPVGRLLAGFAIELTSSKAIPGTWIGRVERIGRTLHADATDNLAAILVRAARMIPRLQRLDVQVFDEDQARRSRIESFLSNYRCISAINSRSYTRTLVVPLFDSDERLLASFSASARRNIRMISRHAGYRFGMVDDLTYAPRMAALLSANFRRTRGTLPQLNFESVLEDAAAGTTSVVSGVFESSRQPPDDLVAFAWGRLHGDHVCYDASASERSSGLVGIPLGYAVVWQLMQWARTRGSTWFDLGGTIPADSPPSHPLHGISSFKRRFSNEEHCIASEFRIVPDTAIGRVSGWIRAAISATRSLR